MKVRWLVAVIVVLLFAASPAEAAPWKQVTASGGSNIDQVGLLRTADGTLHVAWHHPTGPNTEDLLHTTIAADGTVGATVPIVSAWATLSNPALVAGPGGIRVFFGGIHTTDPAETNQEMNTALSADGGATWILQPGSVVPIGAQSYASPVSAAALPDGTPLQAFAGTLGTWVHAGLLPVTANFNYQPPLGNYGYDPGIAADGAGQAVMAWYSNATGHLGVFSQSVAADGSPVGSAANMPGTSNMGVGQLGRTPIVARSGGGFYVASATGYPSLNRVRLWQVGSTSKLIATTNRTGSTTATVAAAADGRVWVAWKDDTGSKPHLLARRSNKAATAFGAAVDAGAPKGAASLYRVDAIAAGDSLDVFGVFGIGTSSSASTFHSRILPGLSLVAKPTTIHRDKAATVTFTVLDAGDPVSGAKVSARGGGATTSATGKATLKLTSTGRSLKVSATAKDYVGATLKLKVHK